MQWPSAMKMWKLWFIFALVLTMEVSPCGSQRGHRDYLRWLYQRFRNIFWNQGSRTRQFAVVTVGQLNEFPNPNVADLPLTNPDDWNAAYYADTIPEHTEPVLFERLRQMILDYLQQFNALPTDIYLFTYNIPCPACTQTIVHFIENVIPDTIRQFVRQRPQFNFALSHIRNMNFRIGWNTERGNQAYTMATVEDFRDTNDDADVPNILLYVRLLLAPAGACRANFNGRKKRHISSLEYLSTDWRRISGTFKHVSAGDGGVWGVNTRDQIFYKPGTYGFTESIGSGDWWLVYGSLTQLDVGYNSVWGVNFKNDVYQRVGISKANPSGTRWNQIPSPKIKYISVSSFGHVWGISTRDEPYWRSGECKNCSQGRSWQQISGALVQISVGWAGVWGVNAQNDVYYRIGTFGDKYGSGSRWQKVYRKLKHVTSGGGLVWGVNENNEIFARHGISSDKPTGLYWIKVSGAALKQIDVSLRGIWGVDDRNMIHSRLATFGFDLPDVSPTWTKLSGLAKHVSTGASGVWSISTKGEILYRHATYGRHRNSRGSGQWHKVDGSLEQLDVGDRVVWGVNSADAVYIREGIRANKPWGTRWREAGGMLKHVSVSPAGSVWGVNAQNSVYRRLRTSRSNPRGTSWTQISGSMKQISSGAAGVWAVNNNDEVFYRGGTFYGIPGQNGESWKKVDGRLKYVSSGENVVWGVNSNDQIYYKDGVTLVTPQGNPWKQVPGRLFQLETYDNDDGIWGVKSTQEIFGHSC